MPSDTASSAVINTVNMDKVTVRATPHVPMVPQVPRGASWDGIKAFRTLCAYRAEHVKGTIHDDELNRFPTEVRLMIFRHLLVAKEKIFCGTEDFGRLDEKEVGDGNVEIPWQILLTCRKYFGEAMPIMYGENRIVFCTGKGGKPGEFWRFPIAPRYMPCLRDLGVYFRATGPTAEGSIRVGHFIKAIARHASKLEHLTVLVSSDTFYGTVRPWDIVADHHPVSRAILEVIRHKTVKHLKIRFHEGASFYPEYASWMADWFEEVGSGENRSLTFSRSCSCPPHCPIYFHGRCVICGWPLADADTKPIEEIVQPPLIEAGMLGLMNRQHAIHILGLLPEDGDTNDDEVDEDVDCFDYMYIVAGRPWDVVEENKLAFDSRGMASTNRLGQERRYRGEVQAPKSWSYVQTHIEDWFTPILKGDGAMKASRPLHWTPGSTLFGPDDEYLVYIKLWLYSAIAGARPMVVTSEKGHVEKLVTIRPGPSQLPWVSILATLRQIYPDADFCIRIV